MIDDDRTGSGCCAILVYVCTTPRDDATLALTITIHLGQVVQDLRLRVYPAAVVTIGGAYQIHLGWGAEQGNEGGFMN